MHEQTDLTPVEDIVLYTWDYGLYIEIGLYIMLGSSFFWALGVPVYLLVGYIINTYNGWLVIYGLWMELTYEKLRYCQTGTYPNCTVQLENEGIWEWVVYPVRRFYVQWILYFFGFVFMSSYPFFGGIVNIGLVFLMYFNAVLY